MINAPDRVLKFGGAALQDAGAVQRVVELAPTRCATPLVVVSAHFGVTRALEDAWQATLEGRLDWDGVRIRHRTLVRELGLQGLVVDSLLRELGTVLGVLARRGGEDPRARDLVLSYGERLSARLVAAAFRQAGVTAFAADAFDLGLVVGRDGLPRADSAPRVRARLGAQAGIPVVTGFLALDEAGHVTTLGRDGSDLTAIWLGDVVGAERVELFKTVPGWLTVAPDQLEGGRELATLPRVLARELASRGAKLLHPRALEVPCAGEIALLDVAQPERGTVLVHAEPERGRPIAVVAESTPAGARITVVGGGIGVDRDFRAAWRDEVGDAGWSSPEATMHAFGVCVPHEARTAVLGRWHDALRLERWNASVG